jgi:hypothetical protein
MEIPFEVKYLNIEWKNKKDRLEIPSRIVESLSPVKIEKISSNEYSFELQTYTRIENNQFGQPAIKILTKNIIDEPYIIDALNNKVPMKLIKNNNGNNWWIEDLIINNNNRKIRGSQFHRQVGKSTIRIGNITCNINIRAISFSVEEFDFYLKDFKENFWKLIFKPDSFVGGNARQNDVKMLNEKSLSLFNMFIKFCGNILKYPKKELNEIQVYQDLKRVKPIPKTFHEIAVKGIGKKLPSRSYKEVFNIPENKYLLFIIKRVYSIVSKILSIQIQDRQYRKQNINTQENRLSSFKSIKKIKKQFVLRDLANMESELKKIKNIHECLNLQDNTQRQYFINKLDNQNKLIQNINRILQGQPPINIQQNLNQYIIILERQQNNTYNNRVKYFGKIKKINSQNWDHFSKGNWLSIEFNLELQNCLILQQEYYINAVDIYNTYNINGNIKHEIFFRFIQELTPLNFNLNYQTLHVKLREKKGNSGNQYFGQIKYNLNDNWIRLNKNNYLVLEFNNKVFDGKLITETTYRVKGFIETLISPPNANGNIEHKLDFKYIDSIDVTFSSLEQKLIRYKKDIELLENQNWERPMTSSEQIKQNQEKNTILKDIKKLSQEQIEIKLYIKQLNQIQNKIKKLIESYELLGIRESSHLPTSMTFIQNENYKNSKKFYNEIKNLVGVNENLYSSVLLIEKIGLIDLPTIYERWTLLKIINMLIYEYGFIPEKNWKESLVGQVLKIKEDIKITLYNDKLKKSITFWYEKKLLNGKRPDFILDVKSLVTNVSKRFIMDAKFKEGEDISKIIKELYFEKNYSENYNNMVFVIHPDQSYIIENLENPQDWANQAYYGETELYYFENKLPNHRYGAILLSPFNNNVYYLDNLKRLISMFLQYGIEKNNKVEKNNFYKYDPMIEEVPFCTLCSSINLNIQPFENKYHNVGIGYKVTCNDCEHVMEYNYCSSCQNRIIKNGRYWSYQATKPIEQFNIKCPHCGDFRLEGLE